MRRTRWLRTSVTYSAPSGPISTPNGSPMLMSRAKPASPLFSGAPVPAIESMMNSSARIAVQLKQAITRIQQCVFHRNATGGKGIQRSVDARQFSIQAASNSWRESNPSSAFSIRLSAKWR